MVTQEQVAKKPASRKLNVGLIGIGVGGLEMIRSMINQPEILNIVAGCDVVPLTLERFKERFPEAKTYDLLHFLREEGYQD